MKQTERTYWRWLALLLLCLLWGGGLPADAAERAWAKYDDATTTLTFYYGEKEALGDGEYEMNEGTNSPGWLEHGASIKRVVFDDSFTEARPKSCYCWFYNNKLLTTVDGIQNLNTSEVTNMRSMFNGCSSLTELNLSGFNTGNVTSMYCMFNGCSSLTELDLSGFDTGNVTSMYCMFNGCSSLTELNLSGFDTGKVTSMYCMFYGCSSLTELNLSGFNTGKVTSMYCMFNGCSSLTELDLSGFDTGNVTSMYCMFNGCSSLTELNLSGFDTGKVTSMYCMFYGCSSLTELNLSGFNTGKVTSMYCMFNGCSSLTELNLSGFSTGSVTTMNSMFNGCSSLTELNLSGFVTGKVKDMNYMFNGCSSLTRLDLSSFNTGNVTSMYCMFNGCSSLTKLDLSGFDTGNVTLMRYMFNGCSSLTELDLSGFDTGNVKDMNYMFNGCKQLVNIYATDNFITERVLLDEDMFKDCVSLVGSIPFDEKYTGKTYATINNGYFVPVRPWAKYDETTKTLTFQYGVKRTIDAGEYVVNTDNWPGWLEHRYDIKRVVFDETFAKARPKSCYNWFGDCGNLTEIEGISNLNTSKVTSMSWMFQYCSKLASLDLSNFSTAKVTDMHNMFLNCSNLASLDLSKFSTAKVTNMSGMFQNCSNLASLDLSKFSTAKVTNMSYMFQNCSKLVYINLSGFNTSNVTDMEYMFYLCPQLQVISASYNFVVRGDALSEGMFKGCTSLQGDIAYDANHVDKTNATINGGYLLSSDKEAKLMWAGYADGTLTFHYDEKTTLGEGEYWPNAGGNKPGWLEHASDIKRVVFDASFAQARPKSCYSWFYDCSNLTEIEGMSNLNTSEVTNMNSMFYSCSQLPYLNLSGFNTSNVTDMSYMFYFCLQLQAISASDKFVVKDGAESTKMFADCIYLQGDIAYNANNVDKTYATINGGYLLSSDKEAKLMWAGYADGTLTFHYDEKTMLGEGEYWLNSRSQAPGWLEHASDIKRVVFDASFAQARPKSCYRWFDRCSNLTEIEGISNLNTSEVTLMPNMFSACYKLAALDVSGFNTEKVTDMYCMFSGCSNLDSLNLSGFNTANVMDMYCMFYSCQQLQVIYASDKFVVKDGAESTNMFGYCTSLSGVIDFDADHTDGTYATVDGGYFTDKQYTRPWAQLADGTLTFRYGYKKDLGDDGYTMNEGIKDPGWASKGNSITRVVFEPSFAKVRPTSCCNWFYGCQMTAIEGLEYLNTSEVTTMGWMFYGCSKLEKLDLSSFDTRKVSGEYGMMTMFHGCSSLTSLDLSSFDTGEVTDMRNMFDGCTSLDTLDLSSFDTHKVNRMGYMFQNCSNLKTIYASDKFVTTADDFWGYYMFQGCGSLVGNIAFDPNYNDGTYASTDGYFLDKQYFRPWAQLADGTLTFRYGYKKNLGSGEYAMNDAGWKKDCDSITRVVFESSFSNARPTSCRLWFSKCGNLSDIEGLKYFNTSHVTDMGYMFYGCSELTLLDFSNFDTQKVTKMDGMFSGCTKLQSIYVSDKFSTANVTDDKDMFWGCTSLVGNIAYDAAVTDKTHANIEGYFLDKQYVRPWAKIESNTLTFRYGYKKTLNTEEKEFEMNEGTRQPLWNNLIGEFAKVVFDPSFAKAKPTSCSLWFNSFWGDIEGIEYLNTSEVKYMYAMFRNSGISSLDLSGFDTRNVETMNSMFEKCSDLTSLDLSSFDTQKVTDMDHMFQDDDQLQTIYVSDLFTVDHVTESDMMFSGCTSLQGYIAYDSHVYDKTHANACGYFIDRQYFRPWAGFDEASSTLTFRYGYKPTLEEDKGEYSMNSLYRISFTKAVFDPSFAEARPTDCSGWFSYQTGLTTIEGIKNLNTSEVTDMNYMFNGCESLESLDISGFDTRNVTDMYGMFAGCRKLTTLDLSGFDTRKVTDMGRMFLGENLQTVYLGAGFSTANVTNHDYMFMDVTSLYCLPDCYDGLCGNSVLAEEGKKVKPYVPINAQAEYGTLCVPVGSQLAEGTFAGFDKLYTVKKADTDKATVTLTEAAQIEPGVPYVYHRSIAEGAPAIIAFEADGDAAVADAPQNDDSMLKGTFEQIIAPGGCYILQMDGMFHPVAAGNTTIPVGAYRAYLDLNTLGEGGAELSKALRMTFGGNTTGIDSIGDLEDEPKVYFDLSGRRVARPQRGQVYILKGKKVKM